MNYFKSGLFKRLFKYILLIIMAPTLLFVLFFSNYVATMREMGKQEMLQSGRDSFNILREDFALMHTEAKIREGKISDYLLEEPNQIKSDSDRFFYVLNSEGDIIYSEGPLYYQLYLQQEYLESENRGRDLNSVVFIESRMILVHIHPVSDSAKNDLVLLSGRIHPMKVWKLLSENFPIDFTFLKKKDNSLSAIYSTAVTPFGSTVCNREISPVPGLSPRGQRELTKKENTITGSRALLFDLRNEVESRFLFMVSLSENYHSEELSRLNVSIIIMISFIVIIIIFSLFAINRHIIAPLYVLTRSAESFISRIKRGETPKPALISNNDEIGELASYFNYIGEELSSYTEKLTDRVRTKTEALSQSNQSLEKALEEANKADRAKTVFLSNMSHEMRTPLHAIIGYTELLQTEQNPETLGKYTRIILNESEKLQGLIGGVLDLARIESGRIRLKIQPSSLLKLTEDLKQNLHVSCMEKNLQYSVVLDRDIHPHVMTDALRLYQVLSNLTGNAIKFTEKGSISVNIQKSGQSGTSSQTIQFTVEDTGIGIPEHMTKQIFNSFVQVDFSRDRKYGGAGLGLSIAREIIAMMGGELTAENRKEGGSKFSFTLTLPISKSIPEAIRSGEPEDFSSLKILLAEDYQPNRGILMEQLKQLGAGQISEAENGLIALEKCKNNSYDIVFMDIHMPVMDGLTSAKAIIKACPDRPALIGLTANANPDDLNSYLRQGLDHILTKPLRKKDMVTFLNAFINHTLEDQDFSEMSGNKGDYDRKIWNYTALLKDLDNNKQLLSQLIHGFFEEWDRESDSLKHNITEGKQDEVYRIIHAVKGAAMNMRAERLAYRAGIICESIKYTLPVNFSSGALEDEINRLKEAVEELIM